jgi:hypothetical protein
VKVSDNGGLTVRMLCWSLSSVWDIFYVHSVSKVDPFPSSDVSGKRPYSVRSVRKRSPRNERRHKQNTQSVALKYNKGEIKIE